jgi:hypothetical protein
MLALILLPLALSPTENSTPVLTAMQGLGDLTLRTLDGDGGWDSKLDFSGATYKAAGVQGFKNTVGLNRYGTRLELQHQVGESSTLSLGLGMEHMTYTGIIKYEGVATEFNEADHWRLDATMFGSPEDAFSWFASARAEAGVVKGINPWDEFVFGGNVGVTLPLMEDLGLKLILDVNERREDSVRLLPLALVDWRISDRWNLGDQVGGYGLGFQLDPKSKYFVALNLEERGYRLDSEGPTSGGTIYDEELSLRGGLAWSPNPGLQLDMFLGLADREMELRAEGIGLGSIEINDAIFGGFRLSLGSSYLK